MTPEQSAILSTIAYCGDLHEDSNHAGYTPNGKPLPIGQSLGEILGNDGFRTPAEGYAQDDWEQLLDQVRNDPELLGFEVRDITPNPIDKGAMITLADPVTKQAVIVFQGTAGPEGWEEDFKSGYMLTRSQQEAIDYANKMTAELGDYYVYATGHSKGGNEAALVAVECDGVNAAYAFDAPGNGQAYFDDPEHAKKAKRNAHKVTYYSNENCFVSGLNLRYDAPEYWLKSGSDEWAGHEELKGILAFSPWAHGTEHLFNGEYGFDYADGPSRHLVEINRFTRWLEKSLPHDDCAYLLDALGRLVAKATDEKTVWTLEEILGKLDPRAIAILLTALEEYPYTAELFNAVLDPGCIDLLREEYGDDIATWTANIAGAGSISSVLFPGAAALLAVWGTALGGVYTGAVKFWMEVTRTKLKAKEGVTQIASAVNNAINAIHTHDFTEEKLAVIEYIVDSFKSSPLVMVFNVWTSLFGGLPFFGWINLAFMNSTVSGVSSLLDMATDGLLNIIRDKFQQAWEADSQQGSALGKAREPLSQAAEMIRTIM